MIGGRLVTAVGVRRLLLIGLWLFAAGIAVDDAVPVDGGYVTDLLPSFLLAGIGFGLCGPALQLGALSGVARVGGGTGLRTEETMREIGGAAGVAAVSTVLVAGSGLDGFHAAFAFIAVLALLGVVIAAVGFARGGRPAVVVR